MKITSKSGKVYEMVWRRFGYTSAEPVLITREYCLFGLIPFDKYTYLFDWADSMTITCIKSAHPSTVRKWFTNTINRYEAYQQAWEEEKLNQ